METSYNPEDTRLEFWKDGDGEWNENDVQNMINLSRFIILYIGRMWYIHEALDASIHDCLTGLVNLKGLTNAIQSLIDQEVSYRYSISIYERI